MLYLAIFCRGFLSNLKTYAKLRNMKGTPWGAFFVIKEFYMLEDNTRKMNRLVMRCLAVCALAIFALLITYHLNIFRFNARLLWNIRILGFGTTLSPLLLYYLKVPDEFLKYYMTIAISILIGTLGCFNDVGIYITFILAPIASCLYFDPKFTAITTCISYMVMVGAVSIN